MPSIRIDCRHYTGSSPCAFHKRDGRMCEGCAECDAIRSRVLIVKLSAPGDVLRTTCILPALHRRWAAAHVTWITDPASRAVLEGHPRIDRLWTSDDCTARLLTQQFDAVYGLDADERAGALSALARAGERFGFGCDEQGRVLPVHAAAEVWWRMGLDDGLKRSNRRSYQALMYEVCGLDGEIAQPFFAVPGPSRQWAARFLATCRGTIYDQAIGLNTGGGRRWAQKKWTRAGYEGFLFHCRQQHPTAALILLGGPEERELNAALMASAVPGVFDAGCENSFADFAALVQGVDVLVTSDSLALHAATAVGTPVVAFVGPTSPWELEVYGRGRVVAAPVDCLGCYLAQCDKAVTCMELLQPDAVLAEVQHQLLAGVQRQQIAHPAPVFL